jgi:hypothetical protein
LKKLNALPCKELGGWINIKNSRVQNKCYGGAHLWLFIQDDFTVYHWAYFIKAKSNLPETMYDWLKLVKKNISLNV